MVASGDVLQLRGVGRGTAAVLEELAAGRQPEVLDEVIGRTPPGVREMLGIAGLGPKKVHSLWHDLGVAGMGELEYACRENRLVELPGFGARTQERLLEAIRDAVEKISREDAAVSVIHGGVGGITANDVMLAEASQWCKP